MWRELKGLWNSDNLLSEAWDQTYEMIEIDREMFLDGIEALWEENPEKIEQAIAKKDKVINQHEREIRKKALTHLSVSGTANLGAGLILSTIIVDIERIGDNVKDIVALAVMHPHKVDAGVLTKDIQKVEAGIKEVFGHINECLANGDEARALELYQNYKQINAECRSIVERLVSGEGLDLPANTSATLALYVRYLKRINAHLRTVLSSVINPYDRIGYKPKITTPEG